MLKRLHILDSCIAFDNTVCFTMQYTDNQGLSISAFDTICLNFGWTIWCSDSVTQFYKAHTHDVSCCCNRCTRNVYFVFSDPNYWIKGASRTVIMAATTVDFVTFFQILRHGILRYNHSNCQQFSFVTTYFDVWIVEDNSWQRERFALLILPVKALQCGSIFCASH
jgi:hypothetical protein